jgi:hypothetical protein
LATDPELGFEFFLVGKGIGGRTVAELREQMSNLEFLHWAQHFALEAQQMELKNKPAVTLRAGGGGDG